MKGSGNSIMQYSDSKSFLRFVGALLLAFVCSSLCAEQLASNEAPIRVVDVCLVPDQALVYAASDCGLLEYGLGGKFKRTYGRSDGLKSLSLTMLAAASNRIWMASARGVGFIERGSVQWFTDADGLPDNRVYAVTAGQDNEIYVGTHRGIARFDGDKFVDVIDSHEFARRPTYNIHAADDGSLWFAKANGMTRRLADGTWQTYQRDTLRAKGRQVLPSNSILSITTDSKLRPWIGTKIGVAVKDGDDWTHLLHRARFAFGPGLRDNMIVSIEADGHDNIWVAHGDSKDYNKTLGVGKLRDGAWRYFTEEDGLPSTSVYRLRADAENRMWLATAKGVCMIADDIVTTFPLPPSQGETNQANLNTVQANGDK